MLGTQFILLNPMSGLPSSVWPCDFGTSFDFWHDCRAHLSSS